MTMEGKEWNDMERKGMEWRGNARYGMTRNTM
jgi:hypothetical protein